MTGARKDWFFFHAIETLPIQRKITFFPQIKLRIALAKHIRILI